VNPFAIETLRLNGIPVGTPRSKSWDEFAKPDSEPIDIVITVCSNAAGEACPIWPGHPMRAHWGVDDPAAIEGSRETILAAFNDAFVVLKYRVDKLVALNVDSLDEKTLKREIARIGTSVP
jgi:arsenate reductase